MVRHGFAYPFDLHALLPVSGPILQLGPSHPDALVRLAAHRRVTDRLRQVVVRERATTERRLLRGMPVIGYTFFTDGETPHTAVESFAKRWPARRFFTRAATAGLSRTRMDGHSDPQRGLEAAEGGQASPAASPVEGDGHAGREGGLPDQLTVALQQAAKKSGCANRAPGW